MAGLLLTASIAKADSMVACAWTDAGCGALSSGDPAEPVDSLRMRSPRSFRLQGEDTLRPLSALT